MLTDGKACAQNSCPLQLPILPVLATFKAPMHGFALCCLGGIQRAVVVHTDAMGTTAFCHWLQHSLTSIEVFSSSIGTEMTKLYSLLASLLPGF